MTPDHDQDAVKPPERLPLPPPTKVFSEAEAQAALARLKAKATAQKAAAASPPPVAPEAVEQPDDEDALMELEEVHEKLAHMKSVWAKLRAEGVPRNEWPLDAELSWGLQFQAQDEVESTGADNMTREHDTDGEADAASRSDTFGLFPMDRPIQTRLLDACRAMLKRATPAQVRDLAYLIYALQRLPSTTPGVCGGVTLATRHGESAAYRGFELNADEFVLTTGESMNFGCGTDHEFRNELEVGTSAMRDIYESGDDFTEWLNLFCGQAEDEAAEIEIHCDVDDDVNLSENTEGIAWEENPLLDAA